MLQLISIAIELFILPGQRFHTIAVQSYVLLKETVTEPVDNTVRTKSFTPGHQPVL